MKIFYWIILLIFISNLAKAQQVTKVECCLEIGGKASIIINDNYNRTIVSTSPPVNTTTVNGGFDFKLDVAANTSAGVYDTNDVLVRTLWSGVRYDAGCYNGKWDGYLDDGTTLAPLGSYTVKVVSNNVEYKWEGVIGNTSTDLTGDYIHKSENLEDLCFVGNKVFFANGYAEHSSSQKMFLTTNPQKLANEKFTYTTQSSFKVCTDGNIVYWAGLNYYSGKTWVFGAYPSDNTNPYAVMFPFSSGVSVSNNDASGTSNYTNAISYNNGSAGRREITGICVQRNGNLLFVARSSINELQVLNKNTGALLQTITLQNIFDVACDDSNQLWVTYNNRLHKFSVAGNGTLTDLNITFSGLDKPTCLGISPDYSTISVGDNGNYQVKSYSTSNDNLTWTLGQSGGFSINPYAANDKFFFIHFIRYAPDGSFWVGDKENFRTLHFGANRSYREFIGFLPTSRTCMADQNDPKRVFANFVEYERNYTKPLDNGLNGSWKLKANWQYGIDNLINTTSQRAESKLDNFSGFYNVVTLGNNRTYGKIFLKDDGIGAEVELTAAGLRYTGADGAKRVGRDGTLFTTENINNNHINIRKSLVIGFSAEGNPVRAASTVFATTPAGSNNEYNPGWAYEGNTGHTNTSNRYVFFNYSSPPQNGNPDAVQGYHLGAVKAGENNYLWKTSKSTFTNYYGAWPVNGDFDIGNGWPQQHSTTRAMVYDHDIFWNANSEFWKGGQVNIWNHFSDNGLLIGNFGVSGLKNNDGAAGMAGNALNNAMVKVGNKDYYIYHCDESVHGGIHSWHVSELNTIAEQIVPLTVSATVAMITDPANLMGGIPFKSSFNGGSGWTVEQPTTGLNMLTNLFQYQKDNTDININGTGTQVVKRSLNNMGSLSSWTLTGGIGMFDSQATFSGDNYNYLEVLDNNSKIIARFQVYSNTGNAYRTYLLVNSNITVAEGGIDELFNNNTALNNFSALRNQFNDFKFDYSGGVLTFKLGRFNMVTISNAFDTGANKTAPAYLKIKQSSSNGQNHAIALYKLKFTSN